MSLLSDETLWIFLLTSNGDVASRHICDVANGVCSLEEQKIKQNNIKLVIDSDKKIIDEYLNKFVKRKYKIFSSKSLNRIVKNAQRKNIVIFIFGHGGLEVGISGAPSIKPHKLLQILKSNTQTENVVVYLSQCFAGIFNYVDVSISTPNIVLIGATNLYPSISAKIHTNGWVANLFMLNLFEWIKEPKDIDGDGKYTVIDSYKYAGAMTNQYCIQYKSQDFENAIRLLEKKKEIQEKIGRMVHDNCDIKLIQLELSNLDAIITNLNNCQTTHYNTQEPWILNAIPAQKIEF